MPDSSPRRSRAPDVAQLGTEEERLTAVEDEKTSPKKSGKRGKSVLSKMAPPGYFRLDSKPKIAPPIRALPKITCAPHPPLHEEALKGDIALFPVTSSR